MSKYMVKAEIVVDADGAAAARNRVLRILAAAEQSGKIYHFGVGGASQK